MRIRITLGTLLCVALLVGCTRCLSPYERAERDLQILEADVRRTVEKEIAEANEKAAETNGVTWVSIKEFQRVVFFVAKPKPKPPAHPDEIEPLVIPNAMYRYEGFSPPIGAVRRQWTDRYALAQRYIYHYTLEEIADVRHGPDLDHPYVATVRVRMKVEHQKAIAADAKPVPEPPAGMKRWRSGTIYGTAFSGGRIFSLPKVIVPGKPSAKVTDLLGKRAVSLLKAENLQERKTILKLTATFSLRDGQWRLATQQGREFLEPTELSWEYGVPKLKGILDPSREQTTS